MGQKKNIPGLASLCLSQEKGPEGSDLLLHLGSPFFICSCELYDYKAHGSVLITQCPNWTVLGPFAGFCLAGAHEFWGFWWLHGLCASVGKEPACRFAGQT